jgi:hypothetical protein
MTLRSRDNWPTLRRRAKRMMRRKFSKTIKLKDFDKIWYDYVEYGIVRPLIKYGRVDVDGNFSLEIVGRKIEDHPKAYQLASKGLRYKRGVGVVPIKEVSANRLGLVYKIELTDKTYKHGKFIFEADTKLTKRVSEHLNNSQQYYRICQSTK